MLLLALLGGHWEWIIVFCDSTVRPTDISNTCLDICRHITSDHPIKRLIILTQCSVQKIDNSLTIDHKFNFEQLSKVSQDKVLDKTVEFQGCEVMMRSVLQRCGNVQHVLWPELVTDIITERTAHNIGGRLQVSEGYFAPRILEGKIYLCLPSPTETKHLSRSICSEWNDKKMNYLRLFLRLRFSKISVRVNK